MIKGLVITTNIRSDIINIESPEQIEIPYKIASPFSRLLAVLLDIFIMYSIIVIIYLLLRILNIINIFSNTDSIRDLFRNTSIGSVSIFFFMVLDFVLQWGYFIFFETLMNGKTPGKALFGLRVINYNGKPLDITSIILRNFIRIFDQETTLYLGAFFCIIFNKEFRRIGDLVAETIVINEDKKSFKFPDFSVVNSIQKPAQKFLHKKLGEEDLYIIRNFLNNLSKFNLDKQHSLSDQLALKIKNTLQDDEDYTDSLLYLQKIYESHKDQ